MLSFFRNNSQSFLLKLILWVLVFSFSFFGIQNIFSSIANPNYAVSVGKQVYGLGSLDQTMRNQLSGQAASLSLEQIQNAYYYQAQSLGYQLALIEDAYEKGFYASDGRIATLITEDPSFQMGGTGFSQDQFDMFLASNNIQYSQYEATIRDEDVMNQLLNAMVTNAKMPNIYLDSLKKEQELMNQSLSLKTLILSNNDYQAPAAPSEEEIQSFYDINKESFRINALKDVRLLKIEPNVGDNFIAANQEIEEAYQQLLNGAGFVQTRNISQILVPEDKIDAATEALKNNQNPEEIAAKLDLQYQNNGPQTYSQLQILGGDIADTVFALKAGEYSPVVATPFGNMVFYVEEILPTPENAPSLEQVRQLLVNQIKAQKTEAALALVLPEFNEKFDETVETIENELGAGTDLETIAKKFGTTTVTYRIDESGLNADKTPTDLSNKTSVLETIASLKPQDIPLVAYEINNDGLITGIYAAAVIAEEPSVIAPLEEVAKSISDQLLREKNIKAQETAVKTLIADNADANLEDLQKKTKATIEQINATVMELGQQILDIDQLRKIASDETNPIFAVNFGNQWAIVQVAERTPVDNILLQQAIDQMQASLDQDYTNSLLSAFSMENGKNHNIKIQQGSIAQLAGNLYQDFGNESQSASQN